MMVSFKHGENNMNKNVTDEKEYLNHYSIEKYERPSLTSDIVAFTVKTQESDDYRKLPERKLSILLVKRDDYPFKGQYALPGGFVSSKESVEENAYRKLKEKAGIEDVVLSQLKVFSKLGRDPRGWVVSCAFMALAEENKYKISSNKRINEKWFSVYYKKQDNDIYNLILENEEDKLSAVIQVGDEFTKGNEEAFKVIKSENIAFDHAEIIACAVQKLRHDLYSHELAFELVPKYFTLTDLQTICEIVLDEKLIKANFRRKIKDLVEETDKLSEGAGHRPARLFVKKSCIN